MARILQLWDLMTRASRTVFPTRALALLLFIGTIDLISTAVLHHYGYITELNPLMKPIIEQSEWLFAAVKGMTLLVAWLFIWKYAKENIAFARKACLAGSFAYVAIWCLWFYSGMQGM